MASLAAAAAAAGVAVLLRGCEEMERTGHGGGRQAEMETGSQRLPINRTSADSARRSGLAARDAFYSAVISFVQLSCKFPQRTNHTVGLCRVQCS